MHLPGPTSLNPNSTPHPVLNVDPASAATVAKPKLTLPQKKRYFFFGEQCGFTSVNACVSCACCCVISSSSSLLMLVSWLVLCQRIITRTVPKARTKSECYAIMLHNLKAYTMCWIAGTTRSTAPSRSSWPLEQRCETLHHAVLAFLFLFSGPFS